MAFLNAVIDGDVMQTVELPLGRVASLLRCPHCDRAGLDLLVSEAQASSQTVRVKASATVNDRLKAVDLQAKYGLGTSNETATTLKDERVLTREERETRALTLLKGTKTG